MSHSTHKRESYSFGVRDSEPKFQANRFSRSRAREKLLKKKREKKRRCLTCAYRPIIIEDKNLHNTKLKFALFLDEEGQIHAREITDMGMISIIKYNSSSQHFIRTLFLSDTTILIILAIIKMLHFLEPSL